MNPSRNRAVMQRDAREMVSIPLTAPYKAIPVRTIAIDHFDAAGSIVFVNSVRYSAKLYVFITRKYTVYRKETLYPAAPNRVSAIAGKERSGYDLCKEKSG
jgi:hypothetical protein